MDGWRMIVRETGGPEMLRCESFGTGLPGPGEVLLHQHAIGVNFIDTYHRAGVYPLPLPLVPGSEAAGEIVAVGDGVTGFAAGDRVAYIGGPPGAYASHRIVAADRLIRLPDWLGAAEAAAVLLKGCTVELLSERCAPVAAGAWALVHAAAGGVGSMLVPWLKARGVRVIAHAGTPEKAARAAAGGAEVALHCPLDKLAMAVRSATEGTGVAVAYDGVGKASWQASLASVAKRGTVVSYGNASGVPQPFSVLDLMRAGSLHVTRPTLGDYIASAAELRHATGRVFAMIEAGVVRATVGRTFALADAAEAHRALEARETVGASVLVP